MARTKEEILADLTTRKNQDPVLAPLLTSNSEAAFYRSLFVLYSEVVGDFELTYDAFEAEITSLLDSKQVQNQAWYISMLLTFQLGDALTQFDNGQLGYSVIDTSKQIVKRAAVQLATAGSLIMKVAKESNNDAVPLSASEFEALAGYINDMTFGFVVTLVSEEGDELKVGLDVYIDAQVINVTDGTLLSDGVTKPVEDAISTYNSELQKFNFGGVYQGNQLLAAILNTTGVINANFTLLEKKSTGDTDFVDVLAVPSRAFQTFSGYVRIADGFILGDNITYSNESSL